MSIKFSDRTGRKNRPINPPENRLISALVFCTGIVIAATMIGFALLTFFPVILLK